MKKYKILFVLFTIFISMNTKADTLVSFLDSSYNWHWDTTGNAWNLVGKEIFSYDSSNNQASDLSLNWDGSMWVNNYLNTYLYDVNHNLVLELVTTWNGTSFVIYRGLFFIYDSNNHLVVDSAQLWNGTGWDSDNQNIYSYDANQDRVTKQSRYWDGTSSTWINDILNHYTYDGNHHLTIDSAFESGGTLFTTDNYTYDVNFNLTSIYETYFGSPVSHQLTTYTYDVNNNRLSFHLFDPGAALTLYYATYTYDVNNNRISTVSFDQPGGILQDSSHYYYHTILVGIRNAMQLNESKVIIYPNPFSNELNFSGTGSTGEIIILDVTGKEVLRRNSNAEQTKINSEFLDPGVYFLRYKENNRTQHMKVIKF